MGQQSDHVRRVVEANGGSETEWPKNLNVVSIGAEDRTPRGVWTCARDSEHGFKVILRTHELPYDVQEALVVVGDRTFVYAHAELGGGGNLVYRFWPRFSVGGETVLVGVVTVTLGHQHEYGEETVGRCLHRHTCRLCGHRYDVDSGD